MAAAATDKFVEVGDPGSATTLAAPGYTIGDSTITVVSTTNWPTATGVVFAMDVIGADGLRVDGSYNVYQGTVATATSITNVSHISGTGTNRNYSAGTTTRVYIVVASEVTNRLVAGLTAEHNQDGTHGAVTATSVATTAGITAGTTLTTDTIAEKTAAAGVTIDGLLIKDSKLATNNSVVTANITDASVTPAKISNTYKFRVSRNAAAGTGNGVYSAALAFDTEQFDTNNNVASGVYTAPATVYYLFTWNIEATLSTGADETLISALFVNGSEYARGGVNRGMSTQGSCGSTLAYMTSGQTADIRVYCDTARSLNVGSIYQNYFSGFFVSV